MPTFETLADRPEVTARQKRREVSAERFAAARDRVANGLSWGVGAIVTDPQGRLLLVSEGGQWLAPGGEVEDGETHEQALRREVREETGVEVTVDTLVAVTCVSIVHGDQQTRFDFAHYTASPETTTLAVDPGLPDEDIDAVEWVTDVPADTVDRDVLVAHR